MKRLIFAPLFALLAACMIDPSLEKEVTLGIDEPDSASLKHEVDIEQELMITAPHVLGSARLDARAEDRIPGPWTFEARLAAFGSGALDAFFAGFAATKVYADPQDPEPTVRADGHALTGVFFESWREQGGCYGCSAGPLPKGNAPMSLTAIVIRLDLASEPCADEGGELRFIYNGFDTKNNRAVPFSVIFEYAVPVAAQRWAKAVHALGSYSFYDDEYRERLLALTQAATADVKNLKAVRTNEKIFTSDWRMREFRVRYEGGKAAALVPVTVAETPDLSYNRSAELNRLFEARLLMSSNDPNPVPAPMQTGEATIPSADFRWEGTASAGGNANGGADAGASADGGSVGGAFSQRTCNGCHGGNRPKGDRLEFMHVSLGAQYYGSTGIPAVQSDYLKKHELPRRKSVLEATLRAECPPEGSGAVRTKSTSGGQPAAARRTGH
jgi:hypothetical protein